MNDTNKRKPIGIRIAITALILSASVLFLGWQIWLWNTQIRFSVFDNDWIRRFMKFFGGEILPDRRAVLYIFSGTAVLMAYYGTVSTGRIIKKNAFRVSTAVSASALGFAAALGATLTYGKAAFWSYLSVAVYGLAIILMIATVYIPVGIRDRKRIFRRDAIQKSAIRYLLTALIALLVVVMSSALLSVFQHVNPGAVRRVLDGFSEDNISAIIVLCVLDQLFEETAFRGLIFGHLEKQITTWPAMIVSSVFFGLWHRNIGQFIYTFPSGIIFCLIMKKTGRLRYPMLCHSLYNLLAFCALVTNPKVIPENFLQDWFHSVLQLPLVAGIAILAASVAAIAVVFVKAFPKEKQI